MDKARLNVWYLLPIVLLGALLVREVWGTSGRWRSSRTASSSSSSRSRR